MKKGWKIAIIILFIVGFILLTSRSYMLAGVMPILSADELIGTILGISLIILSLILALVKIIIPKQRKKIIKTWVSVLFIIIISILILLIVFLFIGRYWLLHYTSYDPECDAIRYCVFSSTNIPCTSDNNCSSDRQAHLYADCELSTNKCDSFINVSTKGIQNERDCINSGGEWREPLCV